MSFIKKSVDDIIKPLYKIQQQLEKVYGNAVVRQADIDKEIADREVEYRELEDSKKRITRITGNISKLVGDAE